MGSRTGKLPGAGAGVRANYFVLTGAMGAGKSAIVAEMRMRKCLCVPDPARQVLEEQRSILGAGVPEADASLFNQLMLSRAMHQYRGRSTTRRPVFFDRGIPDLIAYADLFAIDRAVYERAAARYRYGTRVFWFRGWKEIYTQDDERRMDYRSAEEFGNRVAGIYEQLGYSLVEVPRAAREERARFIIDAVEGRR
jgi:predicted ATPase